MGSVLDVKDTHLNRHIAMKVLRDPTRATPDLLARFIEEAQITGQLEHPGIVPVYELGLDAENAPFYTMKLLRGRTLGQLLDAIEAGEEDTIAQWPIHRLLNLFLKVCEAMRFAHSRKVLHRDLKPDNIMVGEFGEVQVLDWGLAKVMGQPDLVVSTPQAPARQVTSIRSVSDSDRFHSMAGMVMGTPNYMSPEQAAGKVDALDERSDVYGLGAIFYHLLTLSPPAEGADVNRVLAQVRSGTIKAPRELQPNAPHCVDGRIPKVLSAIVMKALAREPSARYQNVGEFSADIEHYMSGHATDAEDAGSFRQLFLFLKRNKTIALASSLVLGAILAGSVISLSQRNRAVGALVELKEEQAERRQLERDSVASLLAQSRIQLDTGDTISATKNLATAQAFDPENVERAFLQALILVDEGRPDEASRELPREHRLAGQLEAILFGLENHQTVAEGDWYPFARVAQDADLFLLATRWANRGSAALAEKLPTYKQQITSSWPGREAFLTIDKKDGLYFRPGIKGNAITSLEPIRSIPLNGFQIHESLTVPADLTPLSDMPLRYLTIRNGKTVDLRPCEGLPLKEIRVEMGRHFEAIAQPALEHLETSRDEKHITSADLAKCTNLRTLILHSTKLDSFRFLEQMPNLKSMRVLDRPADRSFAPLFAHKNITSLNFACIRGFNDPVRKLLLAGEVDDAKQSVRELHESIHNPALQSIAQTLEALEYVLGDQKGTDTNPYIRGDLAIVPIPSNSSQAFEKRAAVWDSVQADLAVFENEEELNWLLEHAAVLGNIALGVDDDSSKWLLSDTAREIAGHLPALFADRPDCLVASPKGLAKLGRDTHALFALVRINRVE